MLAKKLLSYYQNELSYLRKYGERFASHFPKIARRLGLSGGYSEDPHVERIIESFALVTAQIQQKLDEDMPEVTEALLTALAPQFLRPWPSVCIVQMNADSKTSGLKTGSELAAGTTLYSRDTSGHICRFKTLYPVMLQPLTTEAAALQYDTHTMQWHLTLRLKVWPGATFNASSFRLFLHGGNMAVSLLYSLLCDGVEHFSLLCAERYFPLGAADIQPVGFQKGEGILEADPGISPVYTLLQDYFLYPQKFHFLDFRLPSGFSAGSQETITLSFRFRQDAMRHKPENIAPAIDKTFFRLHCTPAVNLFSLRAEPIIPHLQNAEYPVIPDVRCADKVAVWSIDNVSAMHKEGNESLPRRIAPLYGLDRSASDREPDIFWQSIQRQTLTNKGEASAMFIAFSDRSERPLAPQSDLIGLELTCYDQDIPASMKNGHPQGDFDAELPVAAVKIVALTRPTLSVPRPLKQASRWRLISHLSLNHMLISGPNGVAVLKETLSLYSAGVNPDNDRLIDLIKQIDVTPVMARLISHDPRSLARGIEIEVTFYRAAADELGYFLFCRFIEHFLALYAPVNSFSKVITTIEHHEDFRRCWPVRAGRLSWI